ncbi:FAD-binding protein [Devosia beringensis]|uniref:FAD-binding protein n=1 Tax=Devosia beringensis TaxID=2657486 RepID=UPI001AED7DE9|nr:FAD-binding protein [Devosia beringensis]
MSDTIARINPRRPFSVTAEGLKRIVLGEAGQGGAVHLATHRADAPKPLRLLGAPQAHILVIAHSSRGSLDAQAHQAIAAAALLADPATAVAVLVLGELTEDLAAPGADQVHVAPACDGTLFQPDRDLAVATDLIARLDPRHIILPDTAIGTGDLGRRLAARLGAATAAHVVELRPDAVATYRQGGAQLARRDLPRLILLDADTTDTVLPFRGAGMLTPLDAPQPTASLYADRGTPPVDATRLGLEEADFIVAAGNGVTDVPSVLALARTFDAAIGASRVAVDDGRFTREQQVGATGKTVSASVYLALGISGAVQHLQGIKAVRHVIAINTDASAPIAGRADLTLVDDAQAVMTELLAATRGRNFADDANAMPPQTPAGPAPLQGDVRRGRAPTPDLANPRVLVLASLGRNPVNGAARPNRDDLLALEMARGLGETTMLHAGNPDEAAIGDYLAYGATTIDVVPAVPGQDIAEALVAQAAGHDLILTGSRAEGGEGSGLVPYLVAERLGWPVVTQAIAVTVSDGHADITQALPKGQRRHVRVRLPAVIAVDPRAPVTPFYAFARRTAGQVVQHEPTATPALDTAWRLEPAKRPVKFKAKDQKTGHARMLSAIVAETRGGAVIATGSPADKAQAILAYLRTHNLIDW